MGPPTRPDADVDYTFAQVDVTRAAVDYRGNCGNISSAIGPFAIDEALVAAREPVTVVRVHNTNTGKMIHAHVPVEDGEAAVRGDFALDGVPRTGARIALDFVDPGGAVTGRLLPTGHAQDALDVAGLGTITASLVDATNPMVFVRAKDLGLEGTERPEDLDARSGLPAQLEAIRGAAAVRMGLARTPEEAGRASPAVPKIAVLAPPAGYRTLAGATVEPHAVDLVARIVSMGKVHRAFALTGAMCLAVAARIPGSVAHEATATAGAAGDVRIGHPSGVLPVARPSCPEPTARPWLRPSRSTGPPGASWKVSSSSPDLENREATHASSDQTRFPEGCRRRDGGGRRASPPLGARAQARPGVPADPVKIGVLASRAGVTAPVGQAGLRGTEWWAERVNRGGGILGRRVQLIVEEETNPKDTVERYRKLVLQEKVDVVVGVISTGVSLALGSVVEEMDTPWLAWDGTTQKGVEETIATPKWAFRSVDNEVEAIVGGILTAKYFKGVKTIAGINNDYSYGHDCWQSYQAVLKRHGMEVKPVLELFPKLGETNFTSHISAIQQAKPDLLMCSFWSGDATIFMKQAAAVGLLTTMKGVFTTAGGVHDSLKKDFTPEGLLLGYNSMYFDDPKASAAAEAVRPGVQGQAQRVSAVRVRPRLLLRRIVQGRGREGLPGCGAMAVEGPGRQGPRRHRGRVPLRQAVLARGPHPDVQLLPGHHHPQERLRLRDDQPGGGGVHQAGDEAPGSEALRLDRLLEDLIERARPAAHLFRLARVGR